MDLHDIQRRIDRAHRAVSVGESDRALREVRELLDELGNASPVVRFNCAGIMIDAGERLDNEEAVRNGTRLFQELFDDEKARADYGDVLRYNLANGKSSLIHMPRRRTEAPDYRMRDLCAEEEVVRLYYDASERLTSASPEVAINCASMLRVEGRLHEAIDILDSVLAAHGSHPNAHLAMGNILWESGMVCRGRDGRPASLFVAALWHLRRARTLFEAQGESEFAGSTADSAQRLARLIPVAIGVDPQVALAEIGDASLKNGPRAGMALGLTILARSPYRDEDDPWLLEGVPAEERSFLADAVGTFAVARALLTEIPAEMIHMPRWGQDAPTASDHLLYCAVRQLWSVFEKVAWMLNTHLELGLKESECSFARVFAPPPKDARARLGIAKDVELTRHPNLEGDSPGLLALSGIAHAFRDGVYEPIKRLRHTVEHRSPAPRIARNDASFMLGIARAAILHAVDTLL
jgi:hypothetical protein